MEQAEGDRAYPARPWVAVGALVRRGSELLVVRRGHPPSQGVYTVPGGAVRTGERLVDAVRREVAEETGLRVEVGPLAWAGERIDRDDAGRIRYHYVILDYVTRPVGGTLRAGDDAPEVRWVSPDELGRLPLTEGLLEVVAGAPSWP